MKNLKNSILDELIKYKLAKKKNLKLLSNSIRDKDDVKVFIEKKSKVIFLSKIIENKNYYKSFLGHYDTYSTKTKVNLKGNKIIKTRGLDDETRRYSLLSSYLKNKSVLDFGCCWGDFLRLLKKKKIAKKIAGVEIRQDCLKYINNKYKYLNVKDNLNKFDKKFDVITLFHVLEHLTDQVKVLKGIKNNLKKGGKIIVEVPSAQDFLISIDELPEFKKFTFWSEHLLLHTENSLQKYLKLAGFSKIKILFVQRYGFANHLGWLLKKKPGGHVYFEKYTDKKTEALYIESLIKRKKTDTLIGIAEKQLKLML